MRLVRVGAVVAVALLVSWWLARPTLTSAALLMDMTGAAPQLRPWLPARQFDVVTDDIPVPTRYGAIETRLYRAVGASGPALAVFPGVHAGGVDEPRLAALSRRIAATGASVLSAPLPDLRRYRITTNATDMIEDVANWLARRTDLSRSGRIGLVGVSFAGGLTLVAAGRPSLADRLNAVFVLGAHADLPRVIQYLCSADGAPQTLAPPHDYGVVLMLRASIALVVPEPQRQELDTALVTFLDASSAETTDKTLAAELFERARQLEATLPEPSRSLMHAVNARDTKMLGKLLAPHAEQIGGAAALSPARSPATRAPVFLLHGTNDNVIPSSESTALESYLRRAGNQDVDALLTPLISHAEARKNATAGDIWRLVRFWTRMWRRFDP
jgi:dienelactone hydrolase